MGEKLFLFWLFVSLVRVFVKTHSDRCLFTCQGAFPLCRHDGLYKCTDSFRILRIYIVYASDQIKMLCFHFFFVSFVLITLLGPWPIQEQSQPVSIFRKTFVIHAYFNRFMLPFVRSLSLHD